MPDFIPVAEEIWLWPDTCNVYVLRQGDAALLIDLGSGAILDALPRLGVSRVEWVLFTHHHREQCQGAARLVETGARVAVPAGERAFFEDPLRFRPMRPRLNDPYTCCGASYLRPPRLPIRVDHAFAPMDSFQWGQHEFWVLHTPGNSPAHQTFLLRHGGRWLAFSGDLVLNAARMHLWYDSEWDYGYASGIIALYGSVHAVERFEPALLLPSHGPVITDPMRQLPLYREKLRNLKRL
ncbi:MAG: MBL fold metallo-hydrolase, partial [Armatimonadota bacterium]|nr:MBL fold metallo-hydrolase [Armatimonadota bacterium]